MADDYKLSIIIETKSDSAKNNVDQLNHEFGELLKTLGKTPEYARDFSRLATEMLTTGKAAEHVDEETRHLLATYGQLREMAKSRDMLGLIPHKEITRQIQQVEQAFETLKKSGTLSQKEIAQASLVTQGRIRELREQTNGVTASIALARRELAGLAAAGGGLAFAVKRAMDLESAMADVAKTTDLADDALARLSRDIQRLTREIPVSAEELAKLAAAGGQLGIAAENIEEFTRLSAVMGTSFSMTADESAQAVAKLMNVFGLAIGQVRALGDEVNTLGNNTAATERDILDVMTRVGGTARQFGLAADQAAALSAAMLSLGKTPEVAATGINSLLSRLQTANAAGAEFRNALRSIGIDSVKLARDIRGNPQAALENFLGVLEKIDKQARAEVLVKLFGREYQDDIALLVGGLDQYRKALDLVADKTKTAGAMQREFEARIKTAEAQLQLLKNGATEAAVNIGNIFLPNVTKVIRAVTEGTHALAEFTERFPLISQLAASLATAALMAGGLKLVLGAARVAMAGLAIDALQVGRSLNLSLGEAAAAIGKLRLSFGVLASAMIGWDIGTYLRENFEIARKAGVFMVETTVKGFEYLQYAWEAAKAVFTDDTIEEAVKRHERRLAEMNTIFASMYREVEQAVEDAGRKTGEAGKQVAENAEKMARDAARGIEDTLDAAASGTRDLARKAVASVTAAGVELLDLLGKLEDQGKTTGQIVSEALQKISSPDIEFSKLSDLLQPLVRMREESAAAAAAIDRELAGALSRLSAGELADFQGRVEVAFEAAGQGAETFQFLLDAGLSASLARLGVDAERFRTGMSASGKEAVDLFEFVAAQSAATSEQIVAAFDAMLQKISTLDEIDRVRRILQTVGRDGKLSIDQVNAAMERLEKSAESVEAALSPVEAAFKRLGIRSSTELDRIAAEAKKDFEIIRSSGTAAAGDIEQAFKVYAERAMDAARAHGASQAQAMEATLATQRAAVGLQDALEAVGERGAEAGRKIADGMSQAAQAIREADDAARSADEGTGTQTKTSTVYLRQIPHWDVMSEEVRREFQEVSKAGWGSPAGYVLAVELQERIVERVGAALDAMSSLQERLETREMDEALALTIESFIAGAGRILTKDALSDLQGAVDYYRQSERRAAEPVSPPRQTTVVVMEDVPREMPVVQQQPAARESGPPDSRTADALDRVASLLTDIARDVAAIARDVAARHASPRLSSADLAGTMLTALADAATRS